MGKLTGFVRGHLGAAIAAVTAAVVIVGGILLLLVVGAGSTSASSSTPTTVTTVVPPTAGAAGRAGGARRSGVRGQITAINGNTWTVQSARGAPVTVDVTPQTTFGTKAQPEAASDFSVGDRVVVLGSRTGTTVTATRIAAAVGSGAGGTTTVPAG